MTHNILLVAPSYKKRKFYHLKDFDFSYFSRYLTVDYERSTFYLSQCAFQGGATQHIIPILSTNSSTNSTSPNPTSSPASSGSSHSFPIGAIVGIAIGGILLGVVLVLALLFFKKIGPFAKKPEEVSKPPEEPPIEMVEYRFTGKPELDSSPAPVSQKHASEIGGMPVEYYAPEKEGTSAGELEAGPSMIFEMMGDTTRAQELQDTASSPNSPRSPYADRRSHMSGTVSPVSDRGEDSRARRESNLSNGPSP